MTVHFKNSSIAQKSKPPDPNHKLIIPLQTSTQLWWYKFDSTVKSHFIVARLNGESRHINIKKLILILATFIV